MTPTLDPVPLRADNLTWQPLGARHPVLEGLNLAIGAGERVLLAGVSGAGKSTLLRAFAGVLVEHTPGDLGGEVLVDGTPARSGRPDVGLVQQQPHDSVVAETVGRDVAFGPENLGLEPDSIRQRVSESLALVGFPHGERHSTAALSGGQAQRLALAGVLAMRPGVLLLDEPAAMLDADAGREVREAVRQVVGLTGATLVVADHDIVGWVGIVERIVVLDEGRVRFDGSLTEVVSNHAAELLELGLWVPGAPDPEPRLVALPDSTPLRLAAHDLRVARRPALSFRTTERPGHLVLDGQGVTLNAGEFVALRGDSGSGKTTLIQTLLGLLTPESGRVSVEGLPEGPAEWSSMELASRMAWVPQFPEALAVGETVLGSLVATAGVLGRDTEETEALGKGLLEALGLGDKARRHPLSLSGGEQRRLAVASAVLHAPSLILVDEPTVGLDRHAWSAVTGLLLSAVASGAGVLAATHDEALTRRADREVRLTAQPAPQLTVPPAPRPGVARRAGPLSLLASVVLVTVLGLTGSGIAPLAAGWAAMFLIGGALVGFRFHLLRLLPAVIAVLSVAWSNWILASPPSILPAVEAALRIGLVVIPGVVAASLIDPTALGDHLGRRLRLPARPVLALTAALRRLDEFAAVWQELEQARRVRGLGPRRGLVSRGRHWARLCFALLVESLRRAGRLAIAMDARGYSAPGPRTWLGEAPWTRTDTLIVLCGLVIGAVPHLVNALI